MGNVLMILKNITVLIFMQEIMVPFSKSLLKPVDHTAHNAQNKAFYIVYEVCKQRHKLLQKLLNRRCILSQVETLEILYLMSLLISMNMIRIEYTHTFGSCDSRLCLFV